MNIKKNLIESLISLVLVSVVMLLSFIIYFNPSLGWFYSSKNAETAGATVELTASEANADYYAYSYNARYNTLTTYDGQSAGATFINGEGVFELSPFDTIFRARNRYTAGIVRIHLYDISESLSDGGAVVIKLKRNTSIQSLVNGTPYDYSSNLFRFLPLTRQSHDSAVLSTISNKALDQSNTELPELFEAVYNYSNGHLSQSYSFLLGSSGSYTELNEISMSVSYSAQDVLNNQLDIFLYVFYNESVISSLPSGISGTAVIGQIDGISNNIDSMSIILS